MGKPAARIGDFHTCPLVNPGPVPHVGGPVVVGAPNVLIGGSPAARVGDMATCAGPPDAIAMGSPTVLIGGQPAARMGDPTVHGGAVMAGCPTVWIGEAATVQAVVLQRARTAFCEICQTDESEGESGTGQDATQASATGGLTAAGNAQVDALQDAAQSGVPFCEQCDQR